MTAARTAEARRFPYLFATLREPIVARGPYGRTRAVTTVTMTLDESAAFAEAVGAR